MKKKMEKKNTELNSDLWWIKKRWNFALGWTLAFWDSRIQLLDMEIRVFSLSWCFINCRDGFCWVLSKVNSPLLGSERKAWWKELEAIQGLWREPQCIVTDFNLVHFPYELSCGSNFPPLWIDRRIQPCGPSKYPSWTNVKWLTYHLQ